MPSLALAFRFARRPILAAGLCAAIGISARADDRAQEAGGEGGNAKPAAAREDAGDPSEKAAEPEKKAEPERFAIAIEPKLMAAPVAEAIRGSKKSVAAAVRENAPDAAEPVHYYSAEELKALGVEWAEFLAEARAAAGRLLATLKPEIVRDKDGLVEYAVFRSGSHLTSSIVLADGFLEPFRDTLGRRVMVAIPDRFTVFVFPRVDSAVADYGRTFAEIYDNATYPGITELLEVSPDGIRAIGAFNAD
ncbi:MAG: hypothetical protein R3F11_02175 [Verrucomicrobiales bacterium]